MPWPAITARWSAPPPLLPPSPYVYTRTMPLPHTAVIHRRQTDLQEETFLSSHSANLSERSHPNQNTRIYLAFLFLSFVPEFYRFLFFCWCVHIAYVSIWCPVDIVVFLFCFFFNLDFTDLCGFYINMRGGSLGSKLFIGRSIHPLLGTHQKIKMKWFCQLYFYPIGLFHFCHFFFFF